MGKLECHICGEQVLVDDDTVWVIILKEQYPFCTIHGRQLADHLVTMLQHYLHDAVARKEKHEDTITL